MQPIIEESINDKILFLEGGAGEKTPLIFMRFLLVHIIRVSFPPREEKA